MDRWLELLRRHWNYALGQRLDWLNRTRCSVDRCSLIAEPIGEIPEKVTYYSQQSALKETKQLFPEYKTIWAASQQVNLQRLDKAWKRWRVPDATGKRGGRPRFKKVGQLRSFVFSRVNCSRAGAHFNDGILKLSKIGSMPVVVHRPLPDGFALKQATLTKKADGWYVSFSLKDDTVPELMPLATIGSAVGIDVGLEKFLTTSTGETVPIEQPYRKAQKRLARQQRQLARQQKGSANYQKQANRVARAHQNLQRNRKDFHYKVAHQLVRQYDLIAVEELNIKGLARTKLAKSILDAGWGQFLAILEAVAVKRGVWVVRVNPNGTSQECSACGVRVPKTLSVRTHQCPACGLEMDRDENAAINILQRALSEVGLILPACGGIGRWTPVEAGSPNREVGKLPLKRVSA